MKIKAFKTIAIEVVQFFKKYWFYKKNLERYLSMTNVSENELESIKSELFIDFKSQQKKADYYIDNSNILLNNLIVESFYNNNTLFEMLSKEKEGKNSHYAFYDKIFIKSHNQSVEKFNPEELKKSLKFINNEDFNFLVLEKSLNEANIDLLEVVKPFLSWNIDNKKIREYMFLTICKNGKNIKNSPLEKEIKTIISTDNFLENLNKEFLNNSFLNDNRLLFLDCNTQKNINSFFDINIFKLIENIDVNNISLKNLTHKDTINILNALSIEDNDKNSKIFIQYMETEYKKVSIENRINFLIKKNVFTDDFWNESLKIENINFVKFLFSIQDKIRHLIPQDKFKTIMEEYKNYFFKFKNPNNSMAKFVTLYPYELNKEDILNLMNEQNKVIFFSHFELEANNLINEKYPEQFSNNNSNNNSSIKEDDNINKYYLNETNKLLKILYEKYPEIMNDKEFFKNSMQNLTNDSLIEIYIKKYLKDHPNEDNKEFKKEIANKLKIFNTAEQCSKTLFWVIENNLLKEIIPNTINSSTGQGFIFSNENLNKFAPILIEKYNVSPDTIIYQTVTSFISNKELFNFVLKNYTLNPKTEQAICNRVFSIDDTELATEIFRKGIAPNDYYTEKFKSSPTGAGQILLKSKLKQSLEKLEKKPTVTKVRKI